MSTQPNATPSTPGPDQPQTITVTSHTNLLYWWPVWLVGFILAGLTWAEGVRLATVPAGTTVQSNVQGNVFELHLPKDAHAEALVHAADDSAKGKDPFPVRVSRNKSYGFLYIVVLLLVIFGSNVPLRGLASVVAILFIFLITVIFVWMDWWTSILDYLGGLHIEISAAGYLVPSVVLFILWVATVFFYDPMRYMQFTPGQVVLHREVGDQRRVFDTGQVEVEKRRTDLFRHWILGLGAGDLIVKIPSQALQIELPNVMFVGQRVTEIANLMKLKVVLPQ
jgi:hypothetical protein